MVEREAKQQEAGGFHVGYLSHFAFQLLHGLTSEAPREGFKQPVYNSSLHRCSLLGETSSADSPSVL